MKAIEYILTGKEMQLYDKNTIEKYYKKYVEILKDKKEQ